MQVELKGATKKLPGTIRVARLERSVPHEYRSLRKSEKAEITVTKFDDVYGMIEGTFKATMVPALNEGPETVSGSFRVCRGADD